MSIVSNLVRVGSYLDGVMNTDEKRREYGYWGQGTKTVSCGVSIHYDKTGVVSVEELEEPFRTLQWAKWRTSNAVPYPFCDNAKYLIDQKKYAALEEACARALEWGNMPEAAEVWCKSIGKFKEAVLARDLQNPSVNIVYYYDGDDESGVPVCEMAAVREMMTADDYRFYYIWFDSLLDPALDSTRRWYDVVDDRELKRSEVCLGHMGFIFKGPAETKFATFNKVLNDARDSEEWPGKTGGKERKEGGASFNYPMSREHGRMMDAAFVWLCGFKWNAPKKKSVRRVFLFNHQNHSYMWFPVIGDDEFEVDEFISKANLMPEVFYDLLSGDNPKGLTLDENGMVVDSSGVPPKWLTDNGIELYELVIDDARATASKNPFSVESLIRNINRYERENKGCGGAESHKKDFRAALARVLSGNPDYEKRLERLWNDYVKKHILGRRRVAKEIVNLLHRHLLYGTTELKPWERRAVIVELLKACGCAPEDVVESRAFALGKWCNKMAVKQRNAGKQQTFRGRLMRSVYYGKVDVGAEIAAYATMDEEHARKRQHNRIKGIEASQMKYYVPKTSFAGVLHMLASEEYVRGSYDNGEYPVGFVARDGEAFADRPMVRTEGDRNAFLLGYMSGLCPEILESLRQQEEVSES